MHLRLMRPSLFQCFATTTNMTLVASGNGLDSYADSRYLGDSVCENVKRESRT